MSFDAALVPYLFLATFVAALLFGLWQYRRARRAQEEGHRSAAAKVNHEPAAPPHPAGAGGSTARATTSDRVS